MLQSSCQAVLEVQTRDELQREVVKFAQNLGFKTVSAAMVFDRVSGRPEFVNVDNTPPAFEEKFNSAERGARDPVMQHCKTSSRPITWTQSTYVRAKQGDHWEDQAAFGYQSGIAMALHLPEGRHFFLGVDLDGRLASKPDQLRRVVADLQLFTMYAQEAASRVLLPTSRESAESTPCLTPLELETLRWTLDGKTVWEVGKVLSISEAMAVLQLNSAMRKLQCVTKLQAALKARRLGLLRST